MTAHSAHTRTGAEDFFSQQKSCRIIKNIDGWIYLSVGRARVYRKSTIWILPVINERFIYILRLINY